MPSTEKMTTNEGRKYLRPVKRRYLKANRLERGQLLDEMGAAKTGLVGRLGKEGPTVAIRAKTDALPIQELNEVPHRSQVSGAMHPCGHDAHVAIALEAAMLLADSQPHRSGPFRVLTLGGVAR